METTIRQKTLDLIQGETVLTYALHVVLGSLFLGCISQLSVPLQPVPITMQTLGVFILACLQGGKKASLSCLLYLVQASVGLPVLAGMISNPLWMVGTTAGYLAGFPIAAYIIGTLVERKETPTVLWTTFSIICGQLVLYTLGTTWLATFIGFEKAFVLGVLPFVPGAVLKIAIASSASVGWKLFSEQN